MLNYIYLIAFLIFFAAGTGYAKNYAIIKRYTFNFMTEDSRQTIEDKYLFASILYSVFYLLTCIFLMDFAYKRYRFIAGLVYLIFLVYYLLIYGKKGGELSEEREKSHLKTKNNMGTIMMGCFIALIVFSIYLILRIYG